MHSLPNFFLGWPDLPQVQQALFPNSSSISTMQCGGCSLSDRNKVYRTSIFYPILYPSFTPSNPLPRHQALNIFSAACASAGLVEVVWELRRPWLLLTLHVCFQDGINKIDMCVYVHVRMYVRINHLCVYCVCIYIYMYTCVYIYSR